MVPDDRAAVLKAAVDAASKVGQDLGHRKLSALTVAPVAPVVIAKKRAEVAKARPTRHRPSSLVSRLPCVRRPTWKV